MVYERMLLTRQLPRSLVRRPTSSSTPSLRFLSNSTSAKPRIKLIEVGPRDGLQNEKKTIDADTKIELIRRLVGVGLRDVEVGSFVSPKWVRPLSLPPACFQLRASFNPDCICLILDTSNGYNLCSPFFPRLTRTKCPTPYSQLPRPRSKFTRNGEPHTAHEHHHLFK